MDCSITSRERWASVWALVMLCTAIEANAAMLPSLWALSQSISDDDDDNDDTNDDSRATGESIRDDLSLTVMEFGLLTSYISIAPRAMMMYTTGRFAGRVRRKKKFVMVAGILQVIAVGVLLTARGFWQLALAMVLVNISLGIDLPMNAILVGDLFQDASLLAMPIACVTSSIYVGSALGTLAEPLAKLLGWRGAVACFGSFTSLAVLNASLMVSNVDASGQTSGGEYAAHMAVVTLGRMNDDARGNFRAVPPGSSGESVLGGASCGQRAQPPPRGGALIAPDVNPLIRHARSRQKYASMLDSRPSSEVPRGLKETANEKKKDRAGRRNDGGEGGDEDDEDVNEEDGGNVGGVANGDDNMGGVGRQGRVTTSTLAVICRSPPLLLLYLGSGVRYMAGDRRMMVYALNATVSIAVCGTLSQLLGARIFGRTPGKANRLLAQQRQWPQEEQEEEDGQEEYDAGGEAGGGMDSRRKRRAVLKASQGSKKERNTKRPLNPSSSRSLSFTGVSALPSLSFLEAQEEAEDALFEAFIGDAHADSTQMFRAQSPSFSEPVRDEAALTAGEQSKGAGVRSQGNIATTTMSTTMSTTAATTTATAALGGQNSSSRDAYPSPSLDGWLLTGPAIFMVLGGLASLALYTAQEFTVALVALYLTWLLGEGWFSGAITAVQRLLPRGKIRDEGVGIFLACNVLVGASDVFLISQEPMSERGHDDDDGGGGSGGGVNAQVARRTMLLSVSLAYFASAFLFFLASKAPNGGL